jgi:predicted nucleotidyltransferase
MVQTNTAQANQERQQLLEQELQRYLRVLDEDGRAERIILFGSLATGGVHAGSDIDLVVIEQTALPFWQRLRNLRRLLQPQVGTDLFVYTPNEFEQLRQERAFIREEVLKRGRVVYERSR